MPFKNDTELADDVGAMFGEYLATYESETGQVRADVFREGERLKAHVSFPTGLKPYEVTDRYNSELWNYARNSGFEDRIDLIYS
jgi:hypothetical protein